VIYPTTTAIDMINHLVAAEVERSLLKKVNCYQSTFLFFRFSVSDDAVLTLKMVSDDFLKTNFKTSYELYEFIRKNLNNEKLYEKPSRFRFSINGTHDLVMHAWRAAIVT
jgi:hypothetical protein